MKKDTIITIIVLIAVGAIIGMLYWIGKNNKTGQEEAEIPAAMQPENEPKQIKLSEVELICEETETDKLVKYNGIVYGKYFGVVCFAEMPEPTGEINKLISSEYLPTQDGETNSEELLGAKVAYANEQSMVLLYNNDAILYKAIEVKYKDEGLNIVLSLEDEITENTAWCGTFNLVWNDLKNDIAKREIVFSPQLKLVENLNKGTFNASYLSEDSYYKVYGTPSIALKQQIEKAIKEKFNETSDILDDFDWNSNDPKDYFLYAMLKKKFEFPKVFTELESGTFGNTENIKYFGINGSTDKEVREQAKILYYNSKEDFAIKLLTKQNDEVIITRGINSNTFGEIYQKIKEKSKKYEGNYSFGNNDILKIPNININLKKEYKQLENNSFLFANGDSYYIEKALQTIKFKLDKEGGEIKSEAGIMLRYESIMISEDKPREFIADDTFTMFLVEKGKDLPYFAMKISDITNVQE